ncbi:phage virion morphogenesis protein [Acinetobacter sp. c3-l95]|uniref:phage virion morphogenesis protein n=1 Tax=Acinetobacter sp. c3-l95 TaxID=3342804 RepID=UPI0035B7C06B
MIRIDIDGEENIARQISRLIERGHNITPLLQNIGEYVTGVTQERFATSLSPDGERWASNSPVTFARMLGGQHSRVDGRINNRGVNRVMSKHILVMSGMLRNSIHYQVNSMQVLIGTNLVYATTQQFGAGQGAFGRSNRNTPLPWGNIPARPYLGLSAVDKTTIERMVVDYWSYI